jgi:hypothetical protein
VLDGESSVIPPSFACRQVGNERVVSNETREERVCSRAARRTKARSKESGKQRDQTGSVGEGVTAAGASRYCMLVVGREEGSKAEMVEWVA